MSVLLDCSERQSLPGDFCRRYENLRCRHLSFRTQRRFPWNSEDGLDSFPRREDQTVDRKGGEIMGGEGTRRQVRG